MYFFRWWIVVAFCGVVCSGCGTAKIQELTAQVKSLQDQVAALEAKNAELQDELAALQAENTKAQAELARMNEIREGYEKARTEFQKNLAELAPLLGVTGSPLPPFEELKDSSWVGRFAPSPEMKSGLNELEQQLRGLLEP